MQEAVKLEWRRSPLIPILVIQFALLALIGLANIGVDVPVIRQLIALSYLIFIPGTLVLLVLDVSNLNPIEALLYSVGLSLAAIMAIGFTLNTFGLALGVQHPLSTVSLMISMTAVTLSLSGIWYVRNKGRFRSYVISIPHSALPSAMLLGLVPFLSIFGAYLLNFFQIPALLMLLVITVALLVILAGFGKLISRELYPLAIFIIAVALLYHVSLVSTYLTGFDVQIEYNVANLVVSQGYWTPTLPQNYNAMLSLVMLAPSFSLIGGIDLIWVFKAVYPLLFALVPVGMFRIFQKQMDEKTAFLSAFLFMSIFAFYAVMPQLAREEVAELFIVVLILLMTDRTMLRWKKTSFMMFFGFALITSHYGLSYIFLFVMVAAWAAISLATGWSTNKLRALRVALLKRSDSASTSRRLVSRQLRQSILTPSLLAVFFVLALVWYMYASGGSALLLFVNFGNQITTNLAETLFDPTTREGFTVVTTGQTPMRQITLYLTLVTQFFVVVGVAVTVLRRREWHFEDEFFALAIGFFLIGVACFAVPNLATFLSFRFYQLTLLLTAPFFVIGCTFACRFFCNVLQEPWTVRQRQAALSGVSVFLAIFLVFNSGLVYELAHDNPTAISYNPNIDAARFNEKDIKGAAWLLSDVSNDTPLRSDAVGRVLLYGKDPTWVHTSLNLRIKTIFANTEALPEGIPIFLRSYVVETGQIQNSYLSAQYASLNTSVFNRNVLSKTNKIYENGGAQIYG